MGPKEIRESRMMYVQAMDRLDFIRTLEDGSVSLFCIDPPYLGVVRESWDNQWPDVASYVSWLFDTILAMRPKMTPTGSILFFGGIGKENVRPFFQIIDRLDSGSDYRYRNLITWKKRRAYGKQDDYLFCREEIAWYSVSESWTFNIPLLTEKRGYAGFNSQYPAKSEFKRVSNVWDDIGELMRPERSCQKPIDLMDRIILTHSNPMDLVVDCFAGYGSTGISAIRNGRRFLGCEAIPTDAVAANARILAEHDSIQSRVCVLDLFGG